MLISLGWRWVIFYGWRRKGCFILSVTITVIDKKKAADDILKKDVAVQIQLVEAYGVLDAIGWKARWTALPNEVDFPSLIVTLENKAAHLV